MQIIHFKPFAHSDGEVTGYLHTPLTEMEDCRKAFPAVVVCPGGAYRFCSQREDEPVAAAFFARGYQVFSLHYSVGEKAKGFLPLAEASRTVQLLRENAAQWGVEGDHIAVCGFSAGGHLAGSLGCMWNDPRLLRLYDFPNGCNRPDAMVLCYPVVTAGPFAHAESMENVSGCKPGEPGYDYFSLDKQVDGETCPAFLWHTVADQAVPVENSLAMMAALRRAGVPFEAHLFPEGGHGMSICTQETGSRDDYNARWLGLCAAWLDRLFGHCL